MKTAAEVIWEIVIGLLILAGIALAFLAFIFAVNAMPDWTLGIGALLVTAWIIGKCFKSAIDR